MADSSHEMVIAIASVFTAMAILIVILRARARSIKAPNFAIDDYLIFVSLVLFIVCVTVPTLILAVNSHLGDHMVLGPDGKPMPPSYAFNLVLRIFQTVHVLPITFAKLSILFLYRRIFRGPTFNIVSWATIAIAAVWGIAFFLSTLFECTPIDLSLVMPPQSPALTCINQSANFWGLSASDVLIDIVILCIPFPLISSLRMSTSQKVGVSAMFALGGLTIVASIGRLVVFVNAGRLLAANDPDFTYYVAPTAYIVLIESSLAIISACLPVLRPLFTTFSLETMVRSVRSVFSISSSQASSSGADPSTLGGSSLEKGLYSSSTKVSESSVRKNGTAEISVGDLKGSNRDLAGITVERELKQTERRL